MTKLALDTKGIYALRAINGEISFDTEGTEREGIVIISNFLAEVYSRSLSANM
jgi:hypothetical protein